MTRWSVMLTTALVLCTFEASAQQLKLGGSLSGGTGLEGGDPGTGRTAFRRARTRITAGVDGWVDEDPSNALSLTLFAEIEPHVGVGSSLRYMRFVGKYVTGFAGLTGVFAPHTLFGGEIGVQIRIPVTSSTRWFFEPTFSALPLGTDLPGDRVLFWCLLSTGIHASF